MRKLHLALLAAALVVSALALTACGGSSESDEEKITKAIEAAALSDDPATCTEYATLTFLEQVEGEEGGGATKACEKDAEESDDDPDKVAIAKIQVGDGDATAQVAFTGGNLDAQTVEVGLIEEDGQWKLDEMTRFVVFDSKPIVAGLEEAFGEAELNEEQLSCVSEALTSADDATLEDLLLHPSEAALEELVGDC